MIESTKKKYLFIINDGPYGSERPYNALRLAMNMVKKSEASVRVFSPATACNALAKGKKHRTFYYNVERMVKSLAQRGEVAT